MVGTKLDPLGLYHAISIILDILLFCLAFYRCYAHIYFDRMVVEFTYVIGGYHH
jgi:hypothetical protein